MHSIFDEATRIELIERINKVDENCTAQWGKMDVSQMLRHCVQWEEMILGKRIYKQSFLGKLFGKMALKGMIKDDSPVKKNMPTVPEFKVMEKCDVATEKKKWLSLINEHIYVSHPNFVHPFFGKMTKEQVGLLAYKHTDHHLRQFNR